MAALAHGSRLESWQNQGVEDLATPVRATVSWEMPGYVRRTGDMRYFRFPFSKLKFPQATLPMRTHPLYHPGVTSSVFRHRLKLPPGHRLLAIPGPLSVKSPHYEIAASYKLEGDLLHLDFRCDHHSTRVGPGDYPAYRQGLLKAEKYLKQFLFLQVDGGAS